MSNTDLFTPAEAAEFLRTTVSTLATWRTTKTTRIPYIKMARKVLYRRSDLEKWLLSNLHDAVIGG